MSLLDDVPVCTYSTASGTACRKNEAQGSIVYSSYTECAQSNLLLPGFNLLPRWFLAVVYGLALAWCFFGVAIISDIFMEAIEQITSAKKAVKRKTRGGTEQTITVLVWNPTVANLTLMALGSSAPEIMLAVIEAILTLGRVPGELGPSTIVGSAAFNLLVITAVCIVSVPEGQTRSISDFPVFVCTATFSLWAYFWMLIVYQFWTPNQVTLLEALMTLAFLPLLVASAYLINIRPGQQGKSEASEDGGEASPGTKQHDEMAAATLDTGYRIVGADIDGPDGLHMHIKASDLTSVMADLNAPDPQQSPSIVLDEDCRQHALSINADDVVKVLDRVKIDDIGGMQRAAKDLVQQNHERRQKPMTSIQYRINARKVLAGRAPVGFHGFGATATVAPEDLLSKQLRTDPCAKVAFGANAYTCAEMQGRIRLQVICERLPGHGDTTVQVQYATRDGKAIGGQTTLDKCDYQTTSGVLNFRVGETTKDIFVNIFEDDIPETEEEFFVDLRSMPGCSIEIERETAIVTIMDSTEPGRLMFREPAVEVPSTAAYVLVPVARRNGADGRVSVRYRTEDADAFQGIHYQEAEGVLVFESGEKEKNIKILIKSGEVDTHFTVFLLDPEVADLHKKRTTCNICFVTDKQFGMIMRMVQSIVRRQDKAKVESSPWLDQFKDAIIPGGRSCVEDQAAGSLQPLDYILHFVAFSWKVLFALVPPASYKSGGPCFAVSILFIASVTFVVGEFASLFGCALGIPDAVTAISFVALGTSLPDTFASRQAALESPDADAAIGNVTGSNSVNVFLGLGLPWLLSSTYYAAKGESYIAPAGALSFSVTVYMCCSLVCLGLLFIKRECFGGELGGSGFMRSGLALVFVALWVVYLVLSGSQAVGDIKGF